MFRSLILLSIFALFGTPVSAQTFSIPGHAEGVATTTLSVTDSTYMNVTLSSDNAFDGSIYSVPNMFEIETE